jgi:gluconolactonase
MRIIAEGLQFPEGPVALNDGSLLVVEVLGGRLSRVAPDGKVSTVADLGGGPNGAAIGPDGRCYVCNNGGFASVRHGDLLIPQEAPFDTPPGSIQVVDLDTGDFETLYAHCEETPFWGPNDIVFDEAGGFWFTDFGRDRGRIRMRGSVYYAKMDGSEIREVITPIDGPNGVGLSPDGRTLYVALTYEGHLRAFALSGPGTLAETEHGPQAGKTLGRADAGRYLDSLAVDSLGRICVASPGKGGILVFPPEGGDPELVETPDAFTTNICFGGAGMRTAFATLASTGRLVALDWDAPGLALVHQGGTSPATRLASSAV